MPEDLPICAACGETIGTYEPVVAVADQRRPAPARGEGAAAADAPQLRYHMACWSAASRCDERAA